MPKRVKVHIIKHIRAKKARVVRFIRKLSARTSLCAYVGIAGAIRRSQETMPIGQGRKANLSAAAEILRR